MEILGKFILHFEAGLPASKLEGKFSEVFGLASRSGYSDDPCDRGGATMCGVTLRTYRAYCRSKGLGVPDKEELKRISAARWQDILRVYFWNPWKADRISNRRVARVLVDWAWGSGMSVIRRVQRFLEVKADGVVGPVTLAAIEERIASLGEDGMVDALIKQRLAHVDDIVRVNPTQRKFLKGWRRRIEAWHFR